MTLVERIKDAAAFISVKVLSYRALQARARQVSILNSGELLPEQKVAAQRNLNWIDELERLIQFAEASTIAARQGVFLSTTDPVLIRMHMTDNRLADIRREALATDQHVRYNPADRRWHQTAV